MYLNIIVNPVAGRKKHNSHFEFLQEYIIKNNLHGRIYFSKDKGEPKLIASKIEEDNPEGGIIVVCGGDGTLNEVVNGMKDLSKWAFGIVPFGSGNDFAKKIGLPTKNFVKCFDRIVNSLPTEVDYILVNNEVKCLNIAGSGVDIDILERFERLEKLKGSFRYLVATVSSLANFKGVDFKVTLDDGEVFKQRSFISCLCNGSQFGGGIKMCLPAQVDDGYLDFVNCKMINKINLPSKMVRLKTGSIYKCNPKFYTHKLVKKAIFEREDGQEFTLQVDGMLLTDTKFEMKIVPKGFRVFI